jgi:hypothetical protein
MNRIGNLIGMSVVSQRKPLKPIYKSKNMQHQQDVKLRLYLKTKSEQSLIGNLIDNKGVTFLHARPEFFLLKYVSGI